MIDRTKTYSEKLIKDLAEQFKEQPNIEALCEVVGLQLQRLFQFYDDLATQRFIDTAAGQQLDGIGDIVGMTRGEAREMAASSDVEYESDDEMYRVFLKYKLSLNASSCTYSDVLKSIRMQWNGNLTYSENPADPATMTFSVRRFRDNDINTLISVPVVKAAGVKVKYRTILEEKANLYVGISLVQRLKCTYTVQ